MQRVQRRAAAHAVPASRSPAAQHPCSLPCFRLPAHAAAAASTSAHFTPGHDKELADHARPLPNVLLHQLPAAHADEGAVGVVRHRPRQQRFACKGGVGRETGRQVRWAGGGREAVSRCCSTRGQRECGRQQASAKYRARKRAGRPNPSPPPQAPLTALAHTHTATHALTCAWWPIQQHALGLRDAQRIKQLWVLQRQLNDLQARGRGKAGRRAGQRRPGMSCVCRGQCNST
jgi:hypothetical protein